MEMNPFTECLLQRVLRLFHNPYRAASCEANDFSRNAAEQKFFFVRHPFSANNKRLVFI